MLSLFDKQPSTALSFRHYDSLPFFCASLRRPYLHKLGFRGSEVIYGNSLILALQFAAVKNLPSEAFLTEIA